MVTQFHVVRLREEVGPQAGCLTQQLLGEEVGPQKLLLAAWLSGDSERHRSLRSKPSGGPYGVLTLRVCLRRPYRGLSVNSEPC
jgi:hypothetical protein